MARGFRMRGSGAGRLFTADLDGDERRLLAELMGEVAEMLSPPEPQTPGDPFDEIVSVLDATAPDAVIADPGQAGLDPALARLLPSGTREDDVAASEFRRLTEAGLRRRKADQLITSASALRQDTDRVALDGPAAAAFAAALTDVRLVLATRLGVVTEQDVAELETLADEDPDSVLAYALAIYDFVAWLQETLSLALLKALPK